MRALLIVWLAIWLAAGCATMKPVGQNAETVRAKLRSGNVKPNDILQVITLDGGTAKIKVTAIDSQYIVGRTIFQTTYLVSSTPANEVRNPRKKRTEYGAKVVIEIDQIIRAELRHANSGRSALLACCVTIIGFILYLASIDQST